QEGKTTNKQHDECQLFDGAKVTFSMAIRILRRKEESSVGWVGRKIPFCGHFQHRSLSGLTGEGTGCPGGGSYLGDMKAFVLTRHGTPGDSFELRDLPPAPLDEDEVRIRVSAFGLNY